MKITKKGQDISQYWRVFTILIWSEPFDAWVENGYSTLKPGESMTETCKKIRFRHNERRTKLIEQLDANSFVEIS